MRDLHIYSVLGLVAVLLVYSCTKDELCLNSGGQKTTFFSLTQTEGEAVRSTIGTSGAVNFAVADKINYFTGKGSTVRGGTDKSYTIPTAPAAGGTITFPVTYTDGDNKVAFYLKGSSIGAVSGTPNFTGITLTDGVPSSQDGTFEGNHISVASAALDTSGGNQATLTSVQGFIKFKMGSLVFHDTEVNRIVITATGNTDKGNRNICGNMTINPSTGVVSSYGSGTTITLDKSTSKFIVNQDYYVALNAATYTNGLTFTMYNRNAGVDTELGKVLVKLGTTSGKQLVVTPGKVLNIGEIQSHKSVNVANVTLYPTIAATTYTSGKKFWLRILPEDYTGKISVSVTNVDGLLTVVDDGTETLEGIGLCRRYKGTVTNSSYRNYEERKCTVTFTLPAADGYTTASVKCSCIVELGKFYDLGLKNKDGKRCLWGMANIGGSDPNALFMEAEGTCCGYVYPFGSPGWTWWTTEPGPCGNHTLAECTSHNSPYGRWWINDKNTHQKYDPANGVSTLQTTNGQYTGKTGVTAEMNTIDDIAHRANGNWYTPSVWDAGMLENGAAYITVKGSESSQVNGMQGTNVGYTDMIVQLGFGGSARNTSPAARSYYYDFGFTTNEVFMVGFNRYFSNGHVTSGYGLGYGQAVRPVMYR